MPQALACAHYIALVCEVGENYGQMGVCSLAKVRGKDISLHFVIVSHAKTLLLTFCLVKKRIYRMLKVKQSP